MKVAGDEWRVGSRGWIRISPTKKSKATDQGLVADARNGKRSVLFVSLSQLAKEWRANKAVEERLEQLNTN